MRKTIKTAAIAICGVGISIWLNGCKHPDSFFVADSQLGLALASLDNQSEGAQSYKARLTILDPKLFDHAKNNSEAIIYGSDSSFFIRSGSKHIYPNVLQPVANGVAHSFEFLVIFPDKMKCTSPIAFVYQDRYLNQKNYKITISE